MSTFLQYFFLSVYSMSLTIITPLSTVMNLKLVMQSDGSYTEAALLLTSALVTNNRLWQNEIFATFNPKVYLIYLIYLRFI